MRLIAIAGGKGGVGKSVLASNLGVYLAQIGKRVLLVDASPHVFGLGAFLGREAAPRGIEPTDVAGLSLAACVGLAGEAVLELVHGWDGEVAVLDLPASPGPRTRALWRAAQARVLIFTPEPSAIEGAVRFLEAIVADGDRGPKSASDSERGAEAVPKRSEAEPAPRPLLVVGQTRAKSELELGAGLQRTLLRVLGIAVEPIGCVEADEAVWLAVRKRRPLVADYPEARASRDVERIARRLLAREPDGAREPRPVRRLAELGHYELLEVERGSSDEEFRRAHRRTRDLYSPGSLALSGLLTRAQAVAVVRRIEDAYETLIDPERRRLYDQQAFPEDPRPPPAPAWRPAALDQSGPVPNEPAVDGETRFTGELLRRIREARGIDLQDIARRTKVGVGYLTAIEQERWRVLPARVYVRGFLVDYARCLRLDPEQVARSYLGRMAESHAEVE